MPEREIMFVGDLLFYREYPVAIDADMIAWHGVLEALSRVNPSTRIVPGHGPVCSRDDVVPQLHLFDDLRRHSERMLAAGIPVDEASDRYVIPAAFRGYGVFAWSWTIGAAIRSYYRGLRKGRIPATGRFRNMPVGDVSQAPIFEACPCPSGQPRTSLQGATPQSDGS